MCHIFLYILVYMTEHIIQIKKLPFRPLLLLLQAQLHVIYDLTNITNRSKTNVRFNECTLFYMSSCWVNWNRLLLYQQKCRSNKKIYIKKEYFWSLRSISTTCSEDVVCMEILLSTQRKQPENTSNSYICLLSWVACVQLESGVYLFGNVLLC